jgi:ornithine carbamoyltransferase
MRHFLSLSDWSTKELWQLIQLATYLKMEQEAGGNRPILKGRTLALLFQKPSLRTRVS